MSEYYSVMLLFRAQRTLLKVDGRIPEKRVLSVEWPQKHCFGNSFQILARVLVSSRYWFASSRIKSCDHASHV